MVTLMVPYNQIDAESSLVEMFTYVGAERWKLIAAVGALAGLVVSMFGSMVCAPVVYLVLTLFMVPVVPNAPRCLRNGQRWTFV